jgi:hypothetical protein
VIKKLTKNGADESLHEGGRTVYSDITSRPSTSASPAYPTNQSSA